MKVAAVVSKGHLGLVEQAERKPRSGEVLLKVAQVGICGSDIHFLPHAPVGAVLGHEFVGEVVERGADVTNLDIGDRVCSIPCIGCGVCAACLNGDPVKCPDAVFHGAGQGECMGGFGQFIIAGARECIKLPENISNADAALIEPMAVGLHLIERGQLSTGDTLVILGAGPIGLAVTQWAKAHGVVRILVSDPVEQRRTLAEKFGATDVVDPTSEEPGEYCTRVWGGMADVVIECIGKNGRFDLAANAVRRGGRVILGGFLMEPESYDPMTPFTKDLSFEFVIQYAMRHFKQTVDMMAQKRIDPSAMISSQIDLNALPEMMASLMKPNDQCKVLVAPND